MPTPAATEAELAADVAELEALLAAAQSPRVQAFLRSKLSLCRSQLEQQQQQQARQAQLAQAAAAAQAAGPAVVGGTPVSNFSWAQDDESVTVYVLDVEGLSKSDTECDFSDSGFELRMRTADGRNLVLRKRLAGAIDTERSRCRCKPSSKRVTVKLVKREPGSWASLEPASQEAAAKSSSSSGAAAADDPTAGIMDMMKKLYDDGDDQMKQTINKAWAESQEKRAAGDESSAFS